MAPNGVGKTLLLDALATGRPPAGRHSMVTATAHTSRIGYLAQRLDGLAEQRLVLANLQAVAPASLPAQIRTRLARFGLRGDAVSHIVPANEGAVPHILFPGNECWPR